MEGFHPGATFAFEVTPIEHWLELEVGVSAIRADGGTPLRRGTHLFDCASLS